MVTYGRKGLKQGQKAQPANTKCQVTFEITKPAPQWQTSISKATSLTPTQRGPQAEGNILKISESTWVIVTQTITNNENSLVK